MERTIPQWSENRTKQHSPTWGERVFVNHERPRGAGGLVWKLHSCISIVYPSIYPSIYPSRRSSPAVFPVKRNGCILKDLPRATGTALLIGPPSRCHRCLLARFMLASTPSSGLKKMRTIVAHFHLKVVIFLFSGRNAGQQRREGRNRAR